MFQRASNPGLATSETIDAIEGELKKCKGESMGFLILAILIAVGAMVDRLKPSHFVWIAVASIARWLTSAYIALAQNDALAPPPSAVLEPFNILWNVCLFFALWSLAFVIGFGLANLFRLIRSR